MAHFIIEYSTNLDRAQLAPVELLAKLVDAAVATDISPRGGCRARAHPVDEYFVADGRDSFGFVHLQVRLGAGRTEQEKSAACEALVKVLEGHLANLSAQQGLAISFELVELSEHKANINNIRDYLNSA